jgi:hypothetical protein
VPVATLADARDREEFLRIRLRRGDGCKLSRLLLHSFGGTTIGADPERICRVNLEQRSGLFQKPSNGDVIHELRAYPSKEKETREVSDLLPSYPVLVASAQEVVA